MTRPAKALMRIMRPKARLPWTKICWRVARISSGRLGIARRPCTPRINVSPRPATAATGPLVRIGSALPPRAQGGEARDEGDEAVGDGVVGARRGDERQVVDAPVLLDDVQVVDERDAVDLEVDDLVARLAAVELDGLV